MSSSSRCHSLERSSCSAEAATGGGISSDTLRADLVLPAEASDGAETAAAGGGPVGGGEGDTSTADVDAVGTVGMPPWNEGRGEMRDGESGVVVVAVTAAAAEEESGS